MESSQEKINWNISDNKLPGGPKSKIKKKYKKKVLDLLKNGGNTEEGAEEMKKIEKGLFDNLEKEENKENFEKEDFSGLIDKVEEIKKYQKVAEDIIGKEISLEVVEKFIFGQSVEKFKEFLGKNIEIYYLIEFGREENLNKVIELFEIKTKEDLIELAKIEEIVDLIKWGSVENFKKLFELEGFNKEMLIELSKNRKVSDLIKWGRKENFKKLFELEGFNKEMLIELAKNKEVIYLIEYSRKEILEEIVKYINKEKLKLNEIINLFLQNIYIENKDNINLGKYTKSDSKNILELYKKYKAEKKINNSYLGNQEVGDYPFSIINLKVEKELTGAQKRSREYNIGNQKFYDINIQKEKNTTDVQLVINRLFSPFFPMTRLLKLINGEENYVSIDVVNNKDGIELCKLKDKIPHKIEKFFIMIYQFLTIDYDRNVYYKSKKNEFQNLGKKNIIYDFDFIFNKKIEDSLEFLGETFNNQELYNEMEEILFTLKDYLSSEVDELLKVYEEKEDVINILERLRDRLKILNFSNLIYYNEVEKYGGNKFNFKELEKFARKTDKKYYK